MKRSQLLTLFFAPALGAILLLLFWNAHEEYLRSTYLISESIEFIPGRATAVFVKPQCATFYKDEIYVSDLGRDEVITVTKNWDSSRVLLKSGKGPGEVIQPQHLRLTADLMYVSDLGSQRIQVLDRRGYFLRSFRVRLFIGRNFAVNSKGNLFICRAERDGLVAEYDHDGRLISVFGELKDPIEFQNTANIEIDENDNIYVIFFSQAIIQKYNTQKVLQWESDISNLKDVKERLKRIQTDQRKDGIHSVITESILYQGHLWIRTSGISLKDVGGLKLFKFRCTDGKLAGEVVVKSDRVIGFSGPSFDENGNLYFGDPANGSVVVARKVDEVTREVSQ